MKIQLLFGLTSLVFLSGCETIQTPQQRQQASAREQAARRYQEEQVRGVRGQVESVADENARLLQEIQQLRQEVRACNNQVATLNTRMGQLEAKQQREMNELIRRVEGLLKKTVASRPPASSGNRPTGAGREHVVEKGHTLSTIAQAYGTSVKAIKQANNLKSDTIFVGQKLFIPE